MCACMHENLFFHMLRCRCKVRSYFDPWDRWHVGEFAFSSYRNKEIPGSSTYHRQRVIDCVVDREAVKVWDARHEILTRLLFTGLKLIEKMRRLEVLFSFL